MQCFPLAFAMIYSLNLCLAFVDLSRFSKKKLKLSNFLTINLFCVNSYNYFISFK